jgi:hypothetical protein
MTLSPILTDLKKPCAFGKAARLAVAVAGRLDWSFPDTRLFEPIPKIADSPGDAKENNQYDRIVQIKPRSYVSGQNTHSYCEHQCKERAP